MRKIIVLLCLACIFQNKVSANEEHIKGGKIMGKVYFAENLLAEDVSVVLKQNNFTKSFTTNESGYFEFANLPAGNYSLIVSLVGYKTYKKEIELHNAEMKLMDIRLIPNQSQLQDVVIDATQKKLQVGKANIADKDLPLATAQISNKIIQDQQIVRLGEAVKNVPGVSLTQTRMGVNETYSARGYSIGVNGGAGGGSVFKNGLPYNIAGIPEAATLESVEIIKGSAAFLYGSSSGGLIINMVNKKPKFESGGEIALIAGSYQQIKPIIDFYGPLSKKLAYRIVGSYENSNSYRDQVHSLRNYINPSLLFKLSNKTSLLIQQEIATSNLTPDIGIGVLDSGRALALSIPRSRSQNVQWAYNNVSQASSFIHLKHVFNDTYSLQFSSQIQNSDVDAYGVGNLNTTNTIGTVARPLSRSHSLEQTIASQLTLEAKFRVRQIQNQFMAGLDYTKIVTASDGFTILNQNGGILKTYDTINILNPNAYLQKNYIPSTFKTNTTQSPSIRYGLYMQDLIHLHNNFKLFVGTRLSYQSTIQTTIDSTATYNRNAVSVKGTAPTASYLVASPKAGLVFQPFENTSYYISYANNFTTNTGTDVHGNTLPASIVDQYEIGAKQSLLKGRVQVQMAIYKIINSQFAQQAIFKADGVTPNTDATVKTLSGETTSDGFEWGLNAQMTKQFYILSGFSYNHIRFTNSSGKKGANIEGEQLVNAPNHTANLSVFYTFTNKKWNGLKLGLASFYTGKRYGGYNNTVGQAITGSRLLPLSDFTTIDITVGYSIHHWTLQSKISNLLNTYNYLVHDNYSINPIAPRQLQMSIRYRL